MLKAILAASATMLMGCIYIEEDSSHQSREARILIQEECGPVPILKQVIAVSRNETSIFLSRESYGVFLDYMQKIEDYQHCVGEQ